MNAQASHPESSSVPVARLVLSWLWVGIPLSWGIVQTFIKALGLFR